MVNLATYTGIHVHTDIYANTYIHLHTQTYIYTHYSTVFDTSLTLCFSVAPYDVVVMGDNTYTQGQQLQLTCSSEGGPILEYTWLFSDDVIPNENNSTLTIDNVTTTDGGDYTCNVTNDAGADYDTSNVYSE